MRRSQAHALRNILQAVVGYMQIGSVEKATSCVMDAERIIARDVPAMIKPMNSWSLGDGAYINVDVVSSDLVLLQISAKDHVQMTIMFNSYIAHQIGDVLIGVADYAGLPAKVRKKAV
jgi:hypothetical protein